MFLEAVKSYAVWVFPMAVLQAYLNPGWSDWSFTFPNYIVLGYWCLGTLMAYDCYSYFLHRWMHMNKTAFNILHSRHHASIAALDVNTASYMAASEGCLVSGIPFLLLFAAGWSTGNWWYFVLSLYNALYIVIMGHCGHELDMVDFTNVGFALANPFVVFYLTCPCHAVAMDHEIHHKDPR
jgi:sterol desaturase/sphingolipid hydroxylase (fatty acid hydroxylase superfamily)